MLVRWVEGRDHGLVWHHGVALLRADLPADAAERLWADFADGGDVAAFALTLGAVTGTNLLSLPPFAVALCTPDGGWHVASRGDLTVTVDDETVRGGRLSTWSEKTFEAATSVSVGDATSGLARPIAGGIVLTGGLTVGESGVRPAARATWASAPVVPISADAPSAPASADVPGVPSWAASSLDAPSSPTADDVVEPPDGAASDGPDEQLIAGAAVDAVQPAEVVAPDAAPEAELELEPEPAGEPESASEPEPAPASQPAPELPWWARPASGAGLPAPAPLPEPAPAVVATPAPEPAPAVEPAGVDADSQVTWLPDAASEAQPEPQSEPEPDLQPEPEPDAASAFEPPANPGRFARQYGDTQMYSVQDAAVREEDEAFIAGAPGTGGAASAAGGDHDGHTVMNADIPIPVAPMAVGPVSNIMPGVPTVLGVECVNGHPNPPSRAACGVCGGEISGEPRRMARPSLGRVRLPNGERIELTAPVIVGRNPRADRVQGSTLPQLVPLSQGHVSGTHLELRLEEWNVLAVDLRSTNGTFLRRHGEAPVRLGERPELLIQGDVLDLGHGVQLTLEQLR